VSDAAVPPPADRALDAVGALADPVRRALYRHVVASPDAAVGRAQAADAVGVKRTLAAFHLDKLVEAGLLVAEFARPAGRVGPGAGRPAKLYRRSDVETSVHLPPRGYEGAGHILADAIERVGADRAVHAAAHDSGRAAGVTLAASLPADDGEHERVVAALVARGYEPEDADPSGAIRLRNCPFHQLAEDFPPLVCGMNLALLDGLLEGLAATGHRARLDAAPGRCCVIVDQA